MKPALSHCLGFQRW